MMFFMPLHEKQTNFEAISTATPSQANPASASTNSCFDYQTKFQTGEVATNIK